MKNYGLIRFLLATSLVTMSIFIVTKSILAQSSYQLITSHGSVDAYWKVVKPEYGSKKYEVLYKFVNNYSQSVKIKYTANFRCGLADKGTEDSGSFTLAAGETQSGELNGLYHYPCKEGSAPAEIFLQLNVE